MQNLYFRQKITRLSASFLLAAMAVLAGCSDNSGSLGTGTGTGAGTGTGTTNTASLTVSLVSNAISTGTSTTANATVTDSTGAVVPFTVVTFSTDPTMASMTPSNGTALTNASGVASITLTGGANQGATTITATAQAGTAAVTGSTGYTVGATTVTISAPVFGANPLSAFGTTSVTATVTGGGASSQTVNFSSICSSSGKAVLSTGIATVAGVAVASYRDNGCAATDTITVTVSGGLATNSATLVVIPPTTGSIKYISSAPTNISLKGTGGIEVSQVKFQVLDTGGFPLSGKTVTFGLSTTAVGIILTPNTGVAPYASGTATSDADGYVVTNVNAGTVSTPVRVTAATIGTGGVTLTTQSSQLTVTTGIPDQFGFSLAATAWNIEGWNYDGTTAVLTARLADHFKNPVPDGTAVVFTAEAGAVVGSCITVNGACSSTYTSQGTRPVNGRATVLAFAVGEETFTDLNGSGWADLSPNEMIDPNNSATDLPEAFVDYNENGIFDAATETFEDFNGGNIYNAADGKISAALCDDITAGRSSAGSCSTTHTLHVRQSRVMVLSTSQANISISVPSIALPTCGSGGATTSFTVKVIDMNGNAMPAGTTVAFSTDNGTITSPSSLIIGSNTGCLGSYAGCPVSAAVPGFGDIPVTMKTESIPPACANTTPNGTFTVTVTTPSNPAATLGVTKTIATINVSD